MGGGAYSDLERKGNRNSGVLKSPHPSLWLEIQVEPPPEGSGPHSALPQGSAHRSGENSIYHSGQAVLMACSIQLLRMPRYLLGDVQSSPTSRDLKPFLGAYILPFIPRGSLICVKCPHRSRVDRQTILPIWGALVAD